MVLSVDSFHTNSVYSFTISPLVTCLHITVCAVLLNDQFMSIYPSVTTSGGAEINLIIPQSIYISPSLNSQQTRYTIFIHIYLLFSPANRVAIFFLATIPTLHLCHTAQACRPRYYFLDHLTAYWMEVTGQSIAY